jgi:hypothetical protein
VKRVLAAVLGALAAGAVADAPVNPPSKIMWRVICDMGGEVMRIDIGTTGPGVWTLSGEELACTHKVPTT